MSPLMEASYWVCLNPESSDWLISMTIDCPDKLPVKSLSTCLKLFTIQFWERLLHRVLRLPGEEGATPGPGQFEVTLNWQNLSPHSASDWLRLSLLWADGKNRLILFPLTAVSFNPCCQYSKQSSINLTSFCYKPTSRIFILIWGEFRIFIFKWFWGPFCLKHLPPVISFQFCHSHSIWGQKHDIFYRFDRKQGPGDWFLIRSSKTFNYTEGITYWY